MVNGTRQVKVDTGSISYSSCHALSRNLNLEKFIRYNSLQNVGKSTSVAANQIVAAAASAAGLGNNSTMPNQNSSHGVRASLNG